MEAIEPEGGAGGAGVRETDDGAELIEGGGVEVEIVAADGGAGGVEGAVGVDEQIGERGRVESVGFVDAGDRVFVALFEEIDPAGFPFVVGGQGAELGEGIAGVGREAVGESEGRERSGRGRDHAGPGAGVEQAEIFEGRVEAEEGEEGAPIGGHVAPAAGGGADQVVARRGLREGAGGREEDKEVTPPHGSSAILRGERSRWGRRSGRGC